METHLPHFCLCLALALFCCFTICRGGVSDIPTEAFFNGIVSSAADTCAGKNFYKYNDFINAANAFSAFGNTGTPDDNKREIAAFFANVAHETTGLCYVEQIEKSDECDPNYTAQYPCASGKQYYGRGPLQLTWNYNYGAAGNYLNQDLLNNPDTVAQDNGIAWKAALWFWNVNSQCHTAITSGQGFGATIRAINSMECNGGHADQVADRVNRYTNFCTQFGVDPGTNSSC